MAKKKKSSFLSTLLICAGLILGVVALACFAGDGLQLAASYNFLGKEIKGTVHYNLGQFLTGAIAPTVTVVAAENGFKIPEMDPVEGYRSLFVIFALVLTILGTIFTITGLLLKKKGLVLVGGLCFIVAGVFVFLIKIAGTNPENGFKFAEVFNNDKVKYDLGLGTIFYGILSIVGGLTVTTGAILKK